MTADIWRWSATETARAIRSGAISAREATESVLSRIEQVNPAINAVVEVSAQEALEQADRADARRRSGETLGALHGVPVTTKINTDLAGHATTNSVPAFADRIAAEDAPSIENLRRAGAVFVGRTNTPSFSIRWFSDNTLHGRTLNPWDASKTPGGSSGGAGAAVASGMGFIGQGNDIGGSIRYPAACNGVVGLRSTPGRVPDWPGIGQSAPLLGWQQMHVQGPLARTVDDIELAFTAMAGQHPRDPFSVPAPLRGEPLPGPLRVGVVRSAGVVEPRPDVHAALDRAIAALQAAGYVVEEIEAPLFADAWRLWWQVVQGIEFDELGKAIEQFGDEAIQKSAENQFAAMHRLVSGFGLEDYKQGYARRGSLIRDLCLLLERYPLLLQPISAETTFEIDADVRDVDRMEELIKAQWPMMSVAALSVPGLSVPAAMGPTGPIGVQLLARRFREDTLFDAGRAIQARSGVAVPIDPR